jgi:hypothetical protein
MLFFVLQLYCTVTSCIFALGVNITNYVVLGKTSPLTYQVILILKLIVFLIPDCLLTLDTHRLNYLGAWAYEDCPYPCVRFLILQCERVCLISMLELYILFRITFGLLQCRSKQITAILLASSLLCLGKSAVSLLSC